MSNNIIDIRKHIALSIYLGAGGDPTKEFENADEVYAEIDRLFAESGKRIEIEKLNIEIDENGNYTFDDASLTGYKPVEVNVDIDTDAFYNDGYNKGKNDGYDEGVTSGYNKGYNVGIEDQKSKLRAVEFNENGVFKRDDGWNDVRVNIDTDAFYNNGFEDGTASGIIEGISQQKSKLTSEEFNENGTYNREDGWNEVIVNIDTDAFYRDGYDAGNLAGINNQKSKLADLEVLENGTYNREDGWNEVVVAVPIPTFETETLNVELKDNKTYNYTPTTDGFSSVKVTVNVPTSGGGGLVVPFEEIGYDTTLTDELNNYLNSKPLSDFEYSKSLYDAWNPSKTSANSLYKSDKKLVYAPNIDTSKVTSMFGMFQYCYSLTTIPQLDTSKVTSMFYMFNGCPKLTTIPLLNTSNVTDMNRMFYGCSKLTTIPLLNTSNVTDMTDIFRECTSLTTIPQLDTSKIIRMSNWFNGCTSLTTIPQLNTSKAGIMNSMFYGCTSLQSIPLLDTSNVTDIGSIFGFSKLTKLTNLGGFKNLGMAKGLSAPSSYWLSYAPNLTHESLMNVINNLYDRKSAGYSNLSIDLGSTNLAKLTDEEKAIATNKGWTLK